MLELKSQKGINLTLNHKIEAFESEKSALIERIDTDNIRYKEQEVCFTTEADTKIGILTKSHQEAIDELDEMYSKQVIKLKKESSDLEISCEKKIGLINQNQNDKLEALNKKYTKTKTLYNNMMKQYGNIYDEAMTAENNAGNDSTNESDGIK